MKRYIWITSFAILLLPVALSADSPAVKTDKPGRVTTLKADYLIFGTEKNFTNFIQVNARTLYKTLINEVNISYDYGLSKSSSKKWDPTRNLLKTEIKTSYNHNAYDYSFIFEDNQDKISIFSRFYTVAVGGYRGNTRGDVGYGFGRIGHDDVDVITIHVAHEELFESVKNNGGSRWQRLKELVRTVSMDKISYPAIRMRGSFSYKVPRQLESQRSIILTEVSMNYMFTRKVQSIASIKWFYDGNVAAGKQHRYDIRAGLGLTYEF
jgi:hypothetical protein